MNACDFCHKTLSSKRALLRHQNVCNKKEIHILGNQLRTQREQYESQLRTQREQYESQLQSQKEQYEHQIELITEQLNEFKVQIFEIAKQPKQIHHSTTQNNQLQKTLIIQQLAPMTLTRERVESELILQDSEEMFRRGPNAFKEFIIELLHDSETGKPMIMCTDSARRVFIYVDENGEVQKDIGMQHVHTILSGPLQNFAIREYIRLRELYPKQADGLYDILQRIETYVRDINQFADCHFKNMFEKNKVMIQ